MNEKLNEVIFDKAASYKQKTMDVLKQSPTRYSEHKDAGYYLSGPQPNPQKARLSMTDKSPTYSLGNREDRLAHLNVYKELERFELSNSKSPVSLAHRDQHASNREELRSASFSPLRNRSSPLKHQEVPSLYPPELQERIKHSCEKLASTLGLSSSKGHHHHQAKSLFEQMHEPAPYEPRDRNPDTVTFSARAGDTHFAEPSATNLTTVIHSPLTLQSMIKRSLHDLRQRLDSMRRDKEAMESGLHFFESNRE